MTQGSSCREYFEEIYCSDEASFICIDCLTRRINKQHNWELLKVFLTIIFIAAVGAAIACFTAWTVYP